MGNIALYGFNNLTKSLSFSLYKIHYLVDSDSANSYNAYIAQRYCAEQLSSLLTAICHAIGGNVLNVASQDYQPQGASVTLMISEEAKPEALPSVQPASQFTLSNESLVAHMDKSHLCVHTYPEEAPQEHIAIFRADIELSTCGVISPLKVLNYVIDEFGADVIDIDYRVRGMTRANNGKMRFNDGEMTKVSEYLSAKIHTDFDIAEHRLKAQNLYHAKLAKKYSCLDSYLFNFNTNDLTTAQQVQITAQIQQTLQQLFNSAE